MGICSACRRAGVRSRGSDFRRVAVKTKHDMGEKFQGVLFDIDGVLEFQGKAYPGAVELLDTLREKGIHIRILTNSTLKSRKVCAAKLLIWGFMCWKKKSSRLPGQRHATLRS